MRRMQVMESYRQEYAELGHKRLRCADPRNAPRTSVFVNQMPCQGLLVESFEERPGLVS